MITLNNEFRVDLPVDQTWDLLTDLPRVARCLPGATLDDVVDGEYRGGLSTRIGPISAKYRGSASFLERDDVSHRAVIAAKGREAKGSGSANANITAELAPAGDGTLVTVATDLAISGRAAQFGRSLLAEVSTTMVAEFVRRLEQMIQAGDASDGTGTAAESPRAPGGASRQPAVARLGDAGAGDAPEQLDVLSTVALPMLRRAAVPIGGAVLALVAGVVIGRATRSGPTGRGLPVTYVLPYPGTWT
jgi:carbon monoxide dehydrogenase subunit G